MKKEQILRGSAALLQRFVMTYGFTMLATLVFMVLFNRSSLVGWQYFGWCVFFALAANLPALVFVSGHELTEHEWRQRLFLNTLLTEAILMPLGYGRMWTGWGGGALFFITILAVTFGVRALSFGLDTHTAHLLNEQIRKRRLEQRDAPASQADGNITP